MGVVLLLAVGFALLLWLSWFCATRFWIYVIVTALRRFYDPEDESVDARF